MNTDCVVPCALTALGIAIEMRETRRTGEFFSHMLYMSTLHLYGFVVVFFMCALDAAPEIVALVHPPLACSACALVLSLVVRRGAYSFPGTYHSTCIFSAVALLALHRTVVAEAGLDVSWPLVALPLAFALVHVCIVILFVHRTRIAALMIVRSSIIPTVVYCILACGLVALRIAADRSQLVYAFPVVSCLLVLSSFLSAKNMVVL